MFEEVDIPDTVSVIEIGAFDCEPLKSLEWPQNNGDFDTFYGGFHYVDPEVSNGLLASLPASVKTITYDGSHWDGNSGVFNGTVVDLSATCVETISDRAFYNCDLTSIILPNTLKSIGEEAFAHSDSHAYSGASGIDITVPASVTHIGYNAFNNGVNLYSYRAERSFYPSSIHIMNPDFTFQKSDGGLCATIEGESYKVPFGYGQTIYASATDSQGRESFIHKWSQSQTTYWLSADGGYQADNQGTCKVEDLGKYVKNSDGVGAYTFEWVELTAPVTVAGTLPAGATLTMTQGKGSTKKVSEVEVSATGAFSTSASAGLSTVLRVSLAGYYDYTLTRSASAMRGGWSDIVVTTDQMQKIPVKGYMNLRLKRLQATDEGDDPSYANIASDDNFDYTLVDAAGHKVAFTTTGTVLTILANNDDDTTNDIAEDAELALTATPKASVARTYQVGAATTTSTLQNGTFEAVLPAWGTMSVTVDLVGEDSDTSMCVMVFRGNNLVESGTCMDGQAYVTGKHEAGTYTVVAIDSAASFLTRTVTGLTALGLDDFVARQDVTVVDGQKSEAMLLVSPLNTERLMANAGLERAALSLTSKRLVYGGEQTAIIDYQLNAAKTTAAEFRLVLPVGTTIRSCGSNESGASVQSSKVASDDEGDTYSIGLTDASSGRLYVKFVARTAGDCTVGLSAIVGGVTIPISSGSFTCSALTLEPTESVLSSRQGSVTIFAAPTEAVTLAVVSKTHNTIPSQTIQCGASCKTTVNYTLPGTPISGERYILKASIGTRGSADYQEVSKQVTYVAGVTVADLTVTNGDNTFPLLKDGQVQPGGITVLYHAKDKKYARWGFCMTLDASDGQSVENSFTLNVETMGGALVEIPMRKTHAATTEGGNTLFTYVGTYLDEVWLDAYDWAVEHNEGQVGHFDWNEVFVPQTISYPRRMLTSIVAIDPEALEELTQKEYEQFQQGQEQMLQQLIAEYRESLDEGGDVHEALDAYNEVMQGIVDALNAAIRQAAADAGEDVDEDDLIPNHDDVNGYFTEAGVDGVNVDDLLFDDEYVDPYEDPEAAGDDESDWYAQLFGSGQFVDDKGNTIQLNDEEEEALAEAKAELDAAISKADEVERKLASGLGVKSDLSQYSSWTGPHAEMVENSGTKLTDLTQESTSPKPTTPTNELGTTGKYVEKKDNYSGFVASDGTKAHADVTFSEKAAKAWEILYNGITDNFGDIWGTGATLFDEFKGLYVNRGSTLGPLLHRSTRVRRLVTTSLRWMDRTMVRGISVSKAISTVNTVGGNALGIYGVYSANTDYVDAKALWESTRYDIEAINQLIGFWMEKKCPEKADCIAALFDERSACEDLCKLLQSRYRHLGADAVVNTTGTVIGVAGSAVSMGTAGAGAAAAGAVYTAGSATVHAERDLAIDEAWATYKNKTAVRKRLCKSCCPEDDPNCKPCNQGDPSCTPPPPDEGENKIRPEVYLDPSGVVYEAVLSNRVEGAKVTVWRSDNADGSGKVADSSFVATGQVNPQVTGPDGVYQWDVTSGYYQVVVDDGDTFAGTSSGWLPVSPPQLNVNLGVVSTLAPAVTSAAAYTDYVEVIFSQWMQTDAVRVTGIDGATCEWVDTEESGDPDDGDVVYSRVLHIRKHGGFAAGSTVEFGIAADGVTSYNGKGLEAAYGSGGLVVVQRPASILLNIEGDEEGKATELKEQVEATDDIDAYVVDAAGKPLANQRVTVVCGSNDLAAIASLADASSTTVVTNEDGKASFNLAAHLPGMTSLTFLVEGTSLSRTIDLVVEGEQVRPNRPTAVITDGANVTTIDAAYPKSGTIKVTAGATLTLAADEGDDIYYTTNDTCPCTDGSRTKYTGPITLNESTYFRIAAYYGAYDPSEGGYSAYSRRLNLTIEVTPAPAPEVPKVAQKGKTYKVGNFYYKVTNAKTNGSGTVTLTKPAKTTYTSVTVASTVKIYGKSYKVTAIGAKAFFGNKKLKTVKMGANVAAIGTSAFQSCTALTKATIGKVVVTIGTKAYYGCKKLSAVSGGAAVVNIGKMAFASCAKLKSFSITSKNLATIGAQAFSGDGALKTICINKTTKLKTVTNSLKGSKVTTVDVLNSKVKAYQKLFKKSGRSVKVE